MQYWSNIGYFDNYYQTLATRDGLPYSITLSGREIPNANLNYSLNDLARFQFDDGTGTVHQLVTTWYAGTIDVSALEINGDRIYRTREQIDSDPKVRVGQPWYLNPVCVGPTGEVLSTEGVGLGWYCSKLGGGSQVPNAPSPVQSTFRNGGLFMAMAGIVGPAVAEGEPVKAIDAKKEINGNPKCAAPDGKAVALIFDWNFECGTLNENRGSGDKDIPGWHITSGVAKAIDLVAAAKGDSVLKGFLTTLGVPNKSDFAARITAPATIVSNPVILTAGDYGVLRLDLYAPDSSGKVTVQIEGGTCTPCILGTVDLTFADTFSLDAISAGNQTITYGKSGFETFHFTVDPRVQPKETYNVVVIVEGDKTIYLDNVYFRSKNLLFGNPDAPADSTSYDPRNTAHLLIERPQYTVSYNTANKTPNWSAWQINKTWLADGGRLKTGYVEDTTLAASARIPGDTFQPTATRKFDVGHMSPDADRSRTKKDQKATYVMSNMLPQQYGNNEGAWSNLEIFLREKLVKMEGKELYVIAGGAPAAKPGPGIGEKTFVTVIRAC